MKEQIHIIRIRMILLATCFLLVHSILYAGMSSQPSALRNCILVPPKYEYYPLIARLLNEGFTVNRAMQDAPALNIERGTFIIRPDGEAGPASRQFPEYASEIRCPEGLDSKAFLRDDARWCRLKPVVAGIYCGKGVTAGHLWHAEPMETCGIRYVLLDETSMHLVENVDVVCFPSGGGYETYITPEDQDMLKETIHNRGPGFLGTCGGNVFGVNLGLLDVSLLKSKQGFSYALNIHGLAHLDTRLFDHPAMTSAKKVLRPFYFSGQTFSTVGAGVQTLADYRGFGDCFTFEGEPYDPKTPNRLISGPAMIAGSYGKGRVILCGPHPEIGEPQMFVDWIYYLAAGNSSTKRNTGVTAPGMPESPDLIPRPDWAMLSAPVEKMRDTVGCIAPQLEAVYADRVQARIIIGQPLFLLWLDMKKRLDRIRSSLGALELRAESFPKPEEPVHPDIQKMAKRMDVLDATLKQLIPRVLNQVQQMKSSERLTGHADQDHGRKVEGHGDRSGRPDRESVHAGHSGREDTGSHVHYHAQPYMRLVSRIKEPQVFLMGLDRALEHAAAGPEREIASAGAP